MLKSTPTHKTVHWIKVMLKEPQKLIVHVIMLLLFEISNYVRRLASRLAAGTHYKVYLSLAVQNWTEP